MPPRHPPPFGRNIQREDSHRNQCAKAEYKCNPEAAQDARDLDEEA
jgi:hypothetical protein